MRNILTAIAAAAFVLTVSACEKTGSNIKIKPSGELTDTERALLGHLPAGAQVVFGGNYKKFMEYWDDSPMKELVKSMTPSSGAMGDWMDCWSNVGDVEFAGSLQVSAGTGRVRVLFRGLKKAMLEECGQKSSIDIEIDPDGKYLELRGIPDGLGGTSSLGYYFPDDATAFFAMDMQGLTAGRKPAPVKRAQLEADIAKAAASPAVDSADIKDLLVKADRSKPFWFSGSASGTPIADKVTSGHGWMDTTKNAITFRFSVTLTEAAMAKQIVSGFQQTKGQLSDTPAELMPGGQQTKDVALAFFKGASMSHSGGTLAGNFKITNDMLEKLIPLSSAMMPGMRR